MRYSSIRLLAVAWSALVLSGPVRGQAPKRLSPDEVPTFRLRARVVSVGGASPAGKASSFVFDVPGPPAPSSGDAWGAWMTFGRPQVEATLKGYPASVLPGYPVVVRLKCQGVVGATGVEAELAWDEGGPPVRLSGDLFGPTLGILVWRDESKAPKAATMAEYNRRYWQALAGTSIPEGERPRRFVIADRFIGGDQDERCWREGFSQLAGAGINTMVVPPSRPLREVLLRSGIRRIAWATYSPPGYAFDFLDPKVNPATIEAWAQAQAKGYLDSGYAPGDMALFKMSDEPAWYYPSTIRSSIAHPQAMARFVAFLKSQGLAPGDIGSERWEDVRPIGRSGADDLASRRLFYWSMRFFSWDSARHFADCSAALARAFTAGLPVCSNWNNFSGRFYVPGPIANNPDKTSPDAAMGEHDWLEFGRLRGGSMLWTEDWFADAKAFQWSYYGARLRSAAAKGGVEFGAYVVPRASGDRAGGLTQKALSILGSGGKAIEYYVFGPEYTFPGNAYSGRPELLARIAETNRIVARAEDVLWPGRRPRAEVALLAPRSAQVWDIRGKAIPQPIMDATNVHLNMATPDYMAETFDLYLALQHANIPVDFVEEDDLSPQGLKPYRVLYVTEPDLPAENQKGLADWVEGGGTLVTVAGAAAHDRYGEPCSILARQTLVTEAPRDRLVFLNVIYLPEAGRGRGPLGPFSAVGARSLVRASAKAIVARFDDGSPAVVTRTVNRGRVFHFAWLPGLSYMKSATATKDRLPAGFSRSIRRWIVQPTVLAGVSPPVSVDRKMVEAPLLLSDAGAAVTLLNWTGEPLERVRLTVRVPFAVRTVESARRGPLSFEPAEGSVRLSVPLDDADVIALRP